MKIETPGRRKSVAEKALEKFDKTKDGIKKIYNKTKDVLDIDQILRENFIKDEKKYFEMMYKKIKNKKKEYEMKGRGDLPLYEKIYIL